jgi:hypothetical protein
VRPSARLWILLVALIAAVTVAAYLIVRPG